ncbi:MAG: SDR family NAD(P)-dependent oxidoreductase, partial [Anaerolineales bacterium]
MQGRTVLLTGASSGIGAAMARELSARGASVALLARRADRLHALAAELPGEALVIVGDVARADDRANVLEQTLARFGALHGLVNNAGTGGGDTPYAATDPATIDTVLGVNLLGAMHLTRAALPHLRAAGGGFILNVSSPMGALNLPGHTLYCVSKAGLSSFSQVLRRELRHEPITVTDWLPGFVRSE